MGMRLVCGIHDALLSFSFVHVCVPLDLQATPAGMATRRLDSLQENLVQMRERVITQNERAVDLLEKQMSERFKFMAYRCKLKILELKLSRMRRRIRQSLDTFS